MSNKEFAIALRGKDKDLGKELNDRVVVEEVKVVEEEVAVEDKVVDVNRVVVEKKEVWRYTKMGREFDFSLLAYSFLPKEVRASKEDQSECLLQMADELDVYRPSVNRRKEQRSAVKALRRLEEAHRQVEKAQEWALESLEWAAAAQRRAEEAQRDAEEAQRRAEEVQGQTEAVQGQTEEARRQAVEAQKWAEEARRRAEELQREVAEGTRRLAAAQKEEEEAQEKAEEVQGQTEAVSEQEPRLLSSLLADFIKKFEIPDQICDETYFRDNFEDLFDMWKKTESCLLGMDYFQDKKLDVWSRALGYDGACSSADVAEETRRKNRWMSIEQRMTYFLRIFKDMAASIGMDADTGAEMKLTAEQKQNKRNSSARLMKSVKENGMEVSEGKLELRKKLEDIRGTFREQKRAELAAANGELAEKAGFEGEKISLLDAEDIQQLGGIKEMLAKIPNVETDYNRLVNRMYKRLYYCYAKTGEMRVYILGQEQMARTKEVWEKPEDMARMQESLDEETVKMMKMQEAEDTAWMQKILAEETTKMKKAEAECRQEINRAVNALSYMLGMTNELTEQGRNWFEALCGDETEKKLIDNAKIEMQRQHLNIEWEKEGYEWMS